jgi:hypothetical protein
VVTLAVRHLSASRPGTMLGGAEPFSGLFR